MAGCSVTLLKLDEEQKALWRRRLIPQALNAETGGGGKMIITSDDYVAYLNPAAAVIRRQQGLYQRPDAATGDGGSLGKPLTWVFEAIILAGGKN